MDSSKSSVPPKSDLDAARPSERDEGGSPALKFTTAADRELFAHNGFTGFDTLWNLPHVFVDEVNYRRGGWSAVSRLELKEGAHTRVFFVKRQENQLRYSLRRPFGRLTFEDEIDGIRLADSLALPTVEVACYGTKRKPGVTRGLLVTHAIESGTLEDLIDSKPNWNALLPALERIGTQLFRIHTHRIRHGALYPSHIFVDVDSGVVRLIDFESSRLCRSSNTAIKADMTQLLRRLPSMPEQALNALLRPYLDAHAGLLQSLMNHGIKQ